MVLFGHPCGNPNSHHAALAHYEAGRLEVFCVPWFPSSAEMAVLPLIPGVCGEVARLKRRRFEALAEAPKIQGRLSEWRRMAARVAGWGDEQLSYEANDWLMRTMARECQFPSVTAVHSYEDCSLWQFEEAKRLGKPCIYDMPIGYYPWWDEKQKQLAREYANWIPAGGLPSSRYVRPEQKIKEMELADLVLCPSRFVEKTIREFCPDKKIALAPYGVDGEFWSPAEGGEHALRLGEPTLRPGSLTGWKRGRRGAYGIRHTAEGAALLPATSDSPPATNALRFIYAGQSSIRKGTPVLLQAWEKAGMRDAELVLVGSWQLAADRLKKLPPGVQFIGPVGREQLREFYRQSDVFVFPSFFEGLALAFLEAMASGLPVIGTEVVEGMDLIDDSSGRKVSAGGLDELVEALRWFSVHRERLPDMKSAARAKVARFTWKNYRAAVCRASAPIG